jgi:orotate phosphoribosyltransferase-like protein
MEDPKMPATPTHCKRYAISYMWDIHHEIIRLAATGMRPNEIAETLNCSTVMVTYTLNSPIAAAKLAVLRQDRDTAVVSIVDRLKNSASEAAKYLESVAEGRIPEAHPALRVKACTEI